MAPAASSGIPSTNNRRFARNVVIKALFLFLCVNLVFAASRPMAGLGQISAYNLLFPGRPRLPYGDHPERAYNLSLFNLEAMFASHELAASPRSQDEYRVILIGDSSTWGFLLENSATLSSYLNAAGLTLPDGRRVHVYNLGYPVMSLTKDLLILSYAMQYQPDLIIWPLTLESFPYDKQLYPPLLQNNPDPVQALIENHHLKLNPDDPAFVHRTFWQRTLFGQRRQLADLLRFQLYGILWAATGIDQDIPVNYTPRMEDLPAENTFHNLPPPHLKETDLAFDILQAGRQIAGKTPILFVNEPMFISQGKNSDIRYNFYYPRWAYDDYRQWMAEKSLQNGWYYRDLWNLIPASEFTNSAVHLTPAGSRQFADALAQEILKIAAQNASKR
jgi:hypothetical protein